MQTPAGCDDAATVHDQPSNSRPTLSRRNVLAGAAASSFGTILASHGKSAAFGGDQEEFATLRERWRGLWLGTGFDPTDAQFRTKLAAIGATAQAHLDAMAPSPGAIWPDLRYIDPDPSDTPDTYGYSARMNTTITRLREISEAILQPETGLTGDSMATQSVIAGLDQLNHEVYGDGIPRFGNWWHFQVSGPQNLLTTAILLFDHLSMTQRLAYAAAVDYYVPDSIFDDYSGTSTGANRVDLCLSVILRSLLADNRERLTKARDALSPVFPYVTTGDGYYADGSFIQHLKIPYIGGYGAVLVSSLGRIFALLRGSSFQVTDPNQSLFLDTIDRALAPFIFNGLIMDCVSGRQISYSGANDHEKAHAILPSIALIAKGADPVQAARWRGMLKGWVQRDTYDQGLGSRLGIVQLADMHQVMNDPTVVALDEPVEHRVFGNMDRATHRRPGWAAAISAASQRIAFYETGNDQNLRGWHTGAGWLQWWLADDLGQYSDAYWPTVDPYRLPGITASKKHLADAAGGAWKNPSPNTTWVGGTTDGEFGTFGQHLIGFQSSLEAKKSWFSLDSFVVCLGAGISSSDPEAAETVVDNRALGEHGVAAFTVDGHSQPVVQGWAAAFTNPTWAHLEGHAGYVMLQPTVLTAVRDERTGAWRDINAGGSSAPITRRYLTMVIDHGVNATDAGYAYALLPGASLADTESFAGDIGAQVRVCANTPAQQAIQVPSLGLTAVNFWDAGMVRNLSASGPCAVLIRQQGNLATICVSDPGRQIDDLEIIWRHPVVEIVSSPDSLVAATTGAQLRATFAGLSALAGGTQRLVVRLR